MYDVIENKNIKSIDLAARISDSYTKTHSREGHKIILPTIEFIEIDNFLFHCIRIMDSHINLDQDPK